MTSQQLVAFAMNFVLVLGRIISYSIIARIIMSWFTMGRPGYGGRIAIFLRDITDPVINLARRIPHRVGMFDFAPLIALISVDLLTMFIVQLLSKIQL